MPLYDIRAGQSDTPGSSRAPHTVTLDTNCLISLAKGESAAASVETLVLRHRARLLSLRVVAASASERSPGGQSLENYEGFQQFVRWLGLDDLPVLLPLGIYGVTYWDHALYGDDEGRMASLLDQIWTILFANKPRMLSPDTPDRNRMCDALMMWAHIYHEGQVFVSSDQHFHAATKKPRLVNLGAGQILTPAQAAGAFIELQRPPIEPSTSQLID